MKRVNRLKNENKTVRKSRNKKKISIEMRKYMRLVFIRCRVSKGYLKTKVRNSKMILT